MPGAVPETDFVVFGDGIYSCSDVLPTVEHDWEIYHDPPLIFDVLKDPAEVYPPQSSSSSLPLREREDSQNETNRRRSERAIFFWRDGFKTGPLPAPFRRFDVVAMKVGWYNLWFWTKSSLYNADEEVYHDPPLIFDV
eukprot:scaffold22660_cov137-Skeletonema_marinoi.AAC.1